MAKETDQPQENGDNTSKEVITIRTPVRIDFAGGRSMDELFRVGEQAGALGSKPCGAGGGGCLLFLCAAGKKQAVESALREQGGKILSFAFVPAFD